MKAKKGMRPALLLRDTRIFLPEFVNALRSPTISPFRRGNAALSGALDQ